MKRKTKQKKSNNQPVALPSSPPKWINEEWNRLTKFPAYYAKQVELQKTDREDRYYAAIDTIHALMAEEEWLAQNMPYPFKLHHSRIAMLASLTCRHLRQIALSNNHDAITALANIAVDMTETLTELLTRESQAARDDAKLTAELNRIEGVRKRTVQTNAELMQRVARGIPYWPMLRFLNTAANSKKQFQRIAAQLELGKECPINVSESANYSLETLINSFVWKCLRHFQDVHWHIGSNFGTPGFEYFDKPAQTFEEAVAGIVFSKVESPPARRSFIAGMIKQEDIPIYKASYALPPLTKLTAKEWAEKAVMPYVNSKYPDFAQVPEFADILRRDGVKTRGQQRREIKKYITRALTSMARP